MLNTNNNMSKFIATEVKCNGTGGSGYTGALKHKETIINIVDEVKSNLSEDAFWQLTQKQNEQQPYTAELFQGSRYNSSNDLAYRLISGLGQYCYAYLGSNELIEMHLIHILKTLTYEEKQYLVIEAARDCAGADHWYTFEKDWG